PRFRRSPSRSWPAACTASAASYAWSSPRTATLRRHTHRAEARTTRAPSRAGGRLIAVTRGAALRRANGLLPDAEPLERVPHAAPLERVLHAAAPLPQRALLHRVDLLLRDARHEPGHRVLRVHVDGRCGERAAEPERHVEPGADGQPRR